MLLETMDFPDAASARSYRRHLNASAYVFVDDEDGSATLVPAVGRRGDKLSRHTARAHLAIRRRPGKLYN